MVSRKRREHLLLLDSAKNAAETAVDAFNCVWHPYRHEATLLLLTNAWELLAKAVLVAKKESIKKSAYGDTIAAEVAIHRLGIKKLLDQRQVETIQQVISLRHAACHYVLPTVPPEVMQHLLFYSLKFFREMVASQFPAHAKRLSDNFLSISFADLTTYADKVLKSVARIRNSKADKRLVWLLERGITFDGSSYISETAFEKAYRGKYKILPHLGLNGFIKNADMVRIVPIEAPRNFTADISLRRGKSADTALPVVVKRTEVENDYPYLTRELGAAVGKSQNWAARAVAVLGMKGDPKTHQAVRAGATTLIHRYSEAAVARIREKLAHDPSFDPYH